MIYKEISPVCRHCKRDRETLGHILGSCLSTKTKRIKRHDEIKRLVRNRLAVSNTVQEEPTISTGGGRLKPDLVVKTNEGRVLVLDITVRYENRDWLLRGSEEKKEKYSRILGTVKRIYGATSAEVIPIVVGSRGAIPPFTRDALARLKVPRKDMLTISMIALRSSIGIVNDFMDDYWDSFSA